MLVLICTIFALTGVSKAPTVTSSPAGAWQTSYTLMWYAESHTPIVMYSLQYRKYPVSELYIFVFSSLGAILLTALITSLIFLCTVK